MRAVVDLQLSLWATHLELRANAQCGFILAADCQLSAALPCSAPILSFACRVQLPIAAVAGKPTEGGLY